MVVILVNSIKRFQFCLFKMPLPIRDINQNLLFIDYGETTPTDIVT